MPEHPAIEIHDDSELLVFVCEGSTAKLQLKDWAGTHEIVFNGVSHLVINFSAASDEGSTAVSSSSISEIDHQTLRILNLEESIILEIVFQSSTRRKIREAWEESEPPRKPTSAERWKLNLIYLAIAVVALLFAWQTADSPSSRLLHP